MIKLKLVVCFLLFACVLSAVAEDKDQKDEEKKCCPLGKYATVYLMIRSSGSQKEVAAFVGEIGSACRDGYMSRLKCKIIEDKKDADPLEGGFLMQVELDRFAELRRSYSRWTTWSNVYYGSYRLYESKDGDWDKASSGKLRISNLRPYEEYLQWLVLEEMLSVKVKKVRNNPDGTCKVYGYVKNKTDLDFEGISLLAPLDNDTPFVSNVAVFQAVAKLGAGEKENFTIEVPQQFSGKVSSSSSDTPATTARAGLKWKKAYVATVSSILASDKKDEKKTSSVAKKSVVLASN